MGTDGIFARDSGPSSETYGLLGRVYKDKWEEAVSAGRTAEAQGLLRKAIEAYLRGFNTDRSDAYPGINAVTLMALRDPPDDRLPKLLPVVAYAAQRRVEDGVPDYWDHATLLELAILANDDSAAQAHLADALAVVREAWETQTTARNLRLIGEACSKRDEQPEWADEIEKQLNEAFQRLDAKRE